ncbi:uncharacterized protein LOC120282720 [Dioscorea cayenensis subsp. rotundata]|uniref:Uncharacterized protein LOC120282720 n=1 Tax=Dioscorea cayennensis subsp. rotundata TaxID=55577 RepID=A0AB40CZQ3_DIOCR|nr:uncharacterized protein LOC120282720 [Dioscorea cayenensis subsp. rotundata]
MANSCNGMNVSQPGVPIFTGEAYDHWSILMRPLFKSQEVWEIVEDGFDDKDEIEARLRENRKKDSKALILILQSMDRKVFSRVKNSTTTHGAWTFLKNEFQGFAKIVVVRKQRLRHQFKTSRMKTYETIQEYMARVMDVVNQLRDYGGEVTENAIAAKVLRTLSPKFEHVVAAIEESNDLEELTINVLRGSLQSHKDRMIFASTGSEESVLQARIEGPRAKAALLSSDGVQSRGAEMKLCRGRGRVSFWGRGAGRGRGSGADLRGVQEGNMASAML